MADDSSSSGGFLSYLLGMLLALGGAAIVAFSMAPPSVVTAPVALPAAFLIHFEGHEACTTTALV